jgi:hypothetical protein
MAIRFKCTCGALFEVSEENAGRTGRCTRCGAEMIIPRASEDRNPEATQDSGQSIRSETGAAACGPQITPVDSQQSTPRFCPFCGKEMGEGAAICPACFRHIGPGTEKSRPDASLTLGDWILVTVFAPLGFLGGFVSLILGNRKGLHMIGLSTLSMLLMWIMLAMMSYSGAY